MWLWYTCVQVCISLLKVCRCNLFIMTGWIWSRNCVVYFTLIASSWWDVGKFLVCISSWFLHLGLFWFMSGCLFQSNAIDVIYVKVTCVGLFRSIFSCLVHCSHLWRNVVEVCFEKIFEEDAHNFDTVFLQFVYRYSDLMVPVVYFCSCRSRGGF